MEIAKLHNASLVLGSATPSIESYTMALEGKYKLFRLSKRAREGSSIADTHIVDLREELKDLKQKPNKTPEDKEKIKEIEKRINKELFRIQKSENHSRIGKHS